MNSPKVGPYGETYFNERTKRRECRLTESGKEIVLDQLRKYPDPIAMPTKLFPNLTRTVIRIEGFDSANALAAQSLVSSVIKWEPTRASLATVLAVCTKNAFMEVVTLCTKKFGGKMATVSIDRETASGESFAETMSNSDQPDPSHLVDAEDFSTLVWGHVRKMPTTYAEMLRMVYDEGMSIRSAGKRIAGYSPQSSTHIREKALFELRWRMGIPQPTKGE